MDGIRNLPRPPKTGWRIRSSKLVRPSTRHRRGWVRHPPSSEDRHSPPHFSLQPLAFSLAPSPPTSPKGAGSRAILALRLWFIIFSKGVTWCYLLRLWSAVASFPPSPCFRLRLASGATSRDDKPGRRVGATSGKNRAEVRGGPG